ncbi:MAG: hypothetical protein JF565_01865, partial [Propionibacteriales bacterium]|nr:hypothetical protein [Propionibacteriales bacterium]
MDVAATSDQLFERVAPAERFVVRPGVLLDVLFDARADVRLEAVGERFAAAAVFFEAPADVAFFAERLRAVERDEVDFLAAGRLEVVFLAAGRLEVVFLAAGRL